LVVVNLITKSYVNSVLIPSVLVVLAISVIATSITVWRYFGFMGAAVSLLLMCCLALLVATSVLKAKSRVKTIIYSSFFVIALVIFNRAPLSLGVANFGPQAYRELVMGRIERECRSMIKKRPEYSKLQVTTPNGVKLFAVYINGTVPNPSVAKQFDSEFIGLFPELDHYNVKWDVTVESTNERLKGRNGVFTVTSRND